MRVWVGSARSKDGCTLTLSGRALRLLLLRPHAASRAVRICGMGSQASSKHRPPQKPGTAPGQGSSLPVRIVPTPAPALPPRSSSSPTGLTAAGSKSAQTVSRRMDCCEKRKVTMTFTNSQWFAVTGNNAPLNLHHTVPRHGNSLVLNQRPSPASGGFGGGVVRGTHA